MPHGLEEGGGGYTISSWTQIITRSPVHSAQAARASRCSEYPPLKALRFRASWASDAHPTPPCLHARVCSWWFPNSGSSLVQRSFDPLPSFFTSIFHLFSSLLPPLLNLHLTSASSGISNRNLETMVYRTMVHALLKLYEYT